MGDGELDGVVLAIAGLARIGYGSATQVFEPDEMLPAPGQGALAVECRDGEPELAALLATVTDRPSLAAVTAERSLLGAQGRLQRPVGAYAAVAPAGGSGAIGVWGVHQGQSVPPGQHVQLRMRAAVMSADGSRVLRAHGSVPGRPHWQLGRDLAAELLRSGAPISSRCRRHRSAGNRNSRNDAQ